jgi:uncharacterized membrane protein YphA (DoxX/SURF4 family)
MLLRKAKLTLPAIIALVALRLVIGWHFYMEGADKVQKGGFSSTGFLSAAKGPFAKTFQSMVPDFEGKARLDSKAMADLFEGFAVQAGKLYAFTDEQQSEANAISEQSRKMLAEVYKQWKPQIDEHKSGIPRVATNEADEMKGNVASLRKQKDEIEAKWRALAKPALSDIDKVSSDLEAKINAIATDIQKHDGKDIKFAALKLPGAPPIDVKTIDKIIPIFDMVVGILLLLGLLTPVAALAAGLFLASVVLTQFPGSHGSLPTYYQAIEMVGCFVLAFSDAGRYAGLDFFPWSFWNRNSEEIVEKSRLRVS